jgi:hypothetical protein
MRNLTAKQKKIIDTYINSQITKENTWEREQSVFKGNLNYLDADCLPSELYAQIEAINDTEILYQEVNRYMEDKSQQIYNKLR